jgi:hypothetical protein
MLFLLAFYAQHCFGMQQAIVDGQDIFFRDISVKKLACYTITPPANKKLSLPENWLAMDKESQLSFHAKFGGTGIGHESYNPDWEPYFAVDTSVPKICTFISGHHDMKDFCINDYFIDSGATDSIKFDGIEFISSGKSSYPDNAYTWIMARHCNANSYSNFFVSIREGHHKADGESGDYKPTSVQCAALALKYPYAAYCTQNKTQTNFLNVITRSGLYTGRAKLVTITPSIKKISWLHGKNLIGLTEHGDIVTINADTFEIFNQNFGNKKFSDVAVDMRHPWRFIALSEDFSIIYVDFSSHPAIINKDIHWLMRLYNYLFSLPNEVKMSSFNKRPTQSVERKPTYRTIMHLDPIDDLQTYKIWFHNDKIGVYCGEKENTRGTFDIYTLEDRIFTFNTHKICQNGSDKCLEQETLQLDCNKDLN